MALIIANWKMYLTLQEADDFCNNLINFTYPNHLIIAAPAPYLAFLSHKYEDLTFAAQNVSSFGKNGAYTGEYSAEMLKSCNINHTIIGHSERKELFHETYEDINAKILNAINSDITPIICIGEKIKPTYNSPNHLEITSELSKLITILESHPSNNFVLAYEPNWAIGTGIFPTLNELTEVFASMKSFFVECNLVNNIKLVYGGSVNSGNIDQIFSIGNIDGVLIGGFSIDKQNLIEIIQRRYK